MAYGQVVAECVQRLWQVDPHPLPSSTSSQRVHIHAVLVRAIGAASQMGL